MNEDLAARSDPEKVLKAALAEGGEFADLFYERRGSVVATLEGGRLEEISCGVETGVGLRLVRDGREVYAFTNDLGQDALLELARSVSRVERGGDPPGPFDLTERKAPDTEGMREDPEGVPLEKKVDLVRRIDKAARAYSPKIRQVKALYREVSQSVLVVSSLGHAARTVKRNLVLAAQAVAGRNGRIQTGYEPLGGSVGFEIFEERPPEELARAAAERAVMMLEAPRARGGASP